MSNEIPEWLAENYEAVVADENRNATFASIAEEAEARGSQDLAAWARKRAKSKGSDVTPEKATPAPKSRR